jgi:hypothetical protein
MKNKVLYFPYIRVPESTWFTRMLLYWDQVGHIVPYEYLMNPESLGEYTQSLVEHELVHQVIPDSYVWNIPNFDQAFIDYVLALSDLEQRRARFAEGQTFQIHIEKMGGIGEILIGLRLAEMGGGYPWYTVESDTADDFMFYLAATLGQLDEVESIPVTDSQVYLSRCIKAGVAETDIDRQLSALRLEVLEELFPAPNHPLSAEQIRDFKDSYGDKLSGFRRLVERELVRLVDTKEPDLRKHELELFYDEAKEEITEIRVRMRENGFGDLMLGGFCGVLGAVPGAIAGPVAGVLPFLGLVSAIYNFVKAIKPAEPARPSYFAYAAYAQSELLGNPH